MERRATAIRRDPEGKQHQILEAAFREFADHGLAGARLDDIAKRAGVAKGTIYLYFPTKEALFEEMIRGTLITALESAEARLAASDDISAAVQLRTVAVGWWDFLQTERVQVVQRLVMADLRHFPGLIAFYTDAVVSRGRRLIASIVARGTARGEFRPIEPEVGARMLQALAITHSMWRSWRDVAPGLLPSADDTVRHDVIEFFLHALRPDAPADADAPHHAPRV